jgi:hypothetical protein
VSRPDSDLQGLDTLLDLDDYIGELGGGYSIQIRVSRVQPDAGRPHGIQYALSMHAPGGRRILGYDNAHSPPPPRRGPSKRSVTPPVYDHVHKRGKVFPYQFTSPGDLLVDFWNDVEEILKEEGVP